MQYSLILTALISLASAASPRCKVDNHSGCPSASALSCMMNGLYHEQAPHTTQVQTDFYSDLSFNNDNFSLTRTRYCPQQNLCPKIGIRVLPITGRYKIKDVECENDSNGSSPSFSLTFKPSKPSQSTINYSVSANIVDNKIELMTLRDQSENGKSHIMILG